MEVEYAVWPRNGLVCGADAFMDYVKVNSFTALH
jgi:hypothetical protein